MTRPLEGRTVLVTRPKAQAEELVRLLTRAGARVVAVPTIRIRPPSDPAPLRRAARRVLEGFYDHVVFTSPNAVHRFFRLAPNGLTTASFAAIGPKTAQALARRKVRAVLQPTEYRAEGLLRALKVAKGATVLLPRAAKAREVLPETLRRRGARVDVVEAYRTEPDTRSAARLRRLPPPDWITFTSSSTAESLRTLLGAPAWKRLFKTSKAASIGPITSATLRSLGVRPTVEARPYTAAALAKAIVRKS